MRRLPDGVDGPRVLPAPRARRRARGRAARGGPRRRRPHAPRGRRTDDAALHGPARGHLAGSLVLARAVAPGDRLRRHRSGSDGRARPFARVRDVARWVRDELELLGVTGHVKTSGARGLHIYLPMRPGTPFEAGQLFCRLIASRRRGPAPRRGHRRARRQAPRSVARSTSTACRTAFGKTLACAYSARASASPGVSTPLAWKELDRAFDPRAFTIRTLPGRLRDVGDLWARAAQGEGDRSGRRARPRPRASIAT